MCSRFNALKNECEPVTSITINSDNIIIEPSGGFITTGDCKWAIYTLRGTSNSNTPTVNLYRDPSTSKTLDVSAGWAWTFKISIIGSEVSGTNLTTMSYIAEGTVALASDGATQSFELSKESTIVGSGMTAPTISVTAPAGVFTFICNSNVASVTDYRWFGTVEATEASFE